MPRLRRWLRTGRHGPVWRGRDQIVQGSQARVKSLGFFHVWGVEEGGCRSHSGHARGQVQ